MQTRLFYTAPAPSRPVQYFPPAFQRSLAGLAVGAALLGTLTGCVVSEPHQHHQHHARVYTPPPPVYVHDDYVYYPGYEVYYSNSRRQYTYRDGHSWVWRPAPPLVSVDVLFASPSVRLDFHDAPSRHHSRVVQQYPRHWAPPGPGPGTENRDGRR